MSSAKKRTPRRNRKTKSPGPRRLTKKTGDVRSLPEAGKGPSGGAGAGPLSGRAIRHLRGLGHHLEPVVQIGKEGITDAVVAATREALHAHELVKVRVGGEAPVDRKEAGDELAARAGATLAQTLGRTLLLYKRHPHKPKIELPR
jgi:RNA-binding protein